MINQGSTRNIIKIRTYSVAIDGSDSAHQAFEAKINYLANIRVNDRTV